MTLNSEQNSFGGVDRQSRTALIIINYCTLSFKETSTTSLFNILRSTSCNLLSVMCCNLSFGTRGFRTGAPTICYSLSPHVSSCTAIATFCKHLKSLFCPLSPLPSDPSQHLWFVHDFGATQMYSVTDLAYCASERYYCEMLQGSVSTFFNICDLYYTFIVLC